MPTHTRRSLPRTAEALADFLGELLRKRRVLDVQRRRFDAGVGAGAARALDATQEEIAFLDGVLTAVEKGAPWRELDRALARRDNATLAGAVEAVAELLTKARAQYPTEAALRLALDEDAELRDKVRVVALAFRDLDGPTATAAAATDATAAADAADGDAAAAEADAAATDDAADDEADADEADAEVDDAAAADVERVEALFKSLRSRGVLGILHERASDKRRGPIAAAEETIADMAGVDPSTVREARRAMGKLRRKQEGESSTKGG